MLSRSLRYLLFLSVLGSMADGPDAAESNPPSVDFRAQVLPLLAGKCGRCHGDSKQQAGLRLTSAAGVREGGESGAVLVEGKPEESPLYVRVRDGEMPPAGHEPLTAAEIQVLRTWIAEGGRLGESPGDRRELTQHDVIPILLLRCTPCHGGRRQEGGLDLRTKAGLLRGGKSGPAVIAGRPDASRMVQRIKAEEMPPRRQLVAVSVKPMEAEELRIVTDWIAAGLPESTVPAEGATTEPDRLVTDEDREFWSFRAPVRPHPPVEEVPPGDRGRLQNAVDAFLAARLGERSLRLAPEADRATLIRRVTLDLIGLPPTPEEVAAFVADADPRAYEALVDRLLASPHYGERWGRHWLDVAGYADSEGAQNEDRVRPNMWRYRDYVVRAWNADKPYDRFLHEQLAGDELADYEHAAEITDELYDNLVATGFLRTAPDRTFANITNFVPDRLEVIADEIQILGSAVLGLTLHCSRCHSHKFDPIPQRDYYRLAAALKDGLDEHDWLGPDQRQLAWVTTSERQAWERHRQETDAQAAPVKQRLAEAKDEAARKQLEEQLKEVESRRKPEPKIRALWSRGDPSPTYLLKRGNYLTPGAEVSPGVPSVLTDGRTPFTWQSPWPGATATGRRLALARWLTQPDHPLTARVLVNRIWKHHFGSGIVATLANFGRTGAPPTHPALLDWLATELVRREWSIKSLHRLMVTSAAYRQVSQRTAERAAADPDQRLLSHMPLRRMEAEVLRDALLFVAGQLNEMPFGPPDEVSERKDGLVTVKSTSQGGRRSIYVLHRRTKLPTILENFDSPQMGPNCVERGESIVAPQALHLLNNGDVHELAGHFASRVTSEVGGDVRDQVVRVHQLAYGTVPDPEAERIGCEALAELRRRWRDHLQREAPAAAGPRTGGSSDAAWRALQNYCHAIMNSAAFVYVD